MARPSERANVGFQRDFADSTLRSARTWGGQACGQVAPAPPEAVPGTLPPRSEAPRPSAGGAFNTPFLGLGGRAPAGAAGVGREWRRRVGLGSTSCRQHLGNLDVERSWEPVNSSVPFWRTRCLGPFLPEEAGLVGNTAGGEGTGQVFPPNLKLRSWGGLGLVLTFGTFLQSPKVLGTREQ